MNFKAKVVRTVAAAGLTIAMTTGVAFASIGSATVTADSLRLRSEANTGSATLTQAPYGTKVTVEENAGNGWYKVTYLNITLNDGTVIQDQAIPTAAAPQQLRGLVSTDVLNVRAGAGTSFDKVGSLRGGAVVDIVADAGNGWYQISSGYVSAQYITLVDANYQASASNALGDSAAAMARQLVGSRYAYGGTGPYGFLHRIAVLPEAKGKGAAGLFFDELKRQAQEKGIKVLRGDTHRDNKPMQRVMEKNGLTYRGVIHVEDGAERLAYEALLG